MIDNSDDTCTSKSPLGDLGVELRSEEFQEVLGVVPPWILRWGITVLAVIVVILLIGSAIIKYPDVIPAQIVLTGSTPPATIVAHASGKLKELYVTDNQNVKTDDYLAVIDNPAKTKDIQLLKNYLDTLPLNFLKGTFENHIAAKSPLGDLGVGSLQQLYTSFSTTLFEYTEYQRLSYYPQKKTMTLNRISQYENQYATLLTQQQITEEQFVIAQKQHNRDSILHKKGILADEEFETTENVFLQSRTSRENMRSNLNNMQIQIGQLKESLLDTEQQGIEKLNSLQTQLQSLVSQLKTGIEDWELNYALRAPINGKITFSNYWIENQNISAGAEVFTIVPDSAYRIIGKAILPIARSGKVETGQKVNIRLQNFPENEYGILRGTVGNISLVPVTTGETAYYTLEIALPNGLLTTYKKELPYLPNMQGQAEIITEDISLLERFILPLKRILSESL
ncbi:MAG: HlyD family efflux transporter periplasmic adaptor subunit [Candidatus Azobacteroides sp.]|nr:HlyD family efflux transporter periplasmic adaptor subunit [Candidatus Azobacteroides sp.]